MAATGALESLYRETILDHSSQPRNFGVLAGADRQATGHNPLCGDKVTVYLKLGRDRRIEAATFEGTGCAISTASASMLTERVRGMSDTEASAMVGVLNDMFTGTSDTTVSGDLAALSGVRRYPSRIRCATLPWRTLDAALHDDPRPVSTEA